MVLSYFPLGWMPAKTASKSAPNAASAGGLQVAVFARRSFLRETTDFRHKRETKKITSRSSASTPTFRPVFNMITVRLLLTVASLAVFSGCVFSNKARRAKESTAISADVEESFRKRWVEKRSGELAAQGSSADVARTKAEAEFRERYEFTRAAAQK